MLYFFFFCVCTQCDDIKVLKSVSKNTKKEKNKVLKNAEHTYKTKKNKKKTKKNKKTKNNKKKGDLTENLSLKKTNFEFPKHAGSRFGGVGYFNVFKSKEREHLKLIKFGGVDDHGDTCFYLDDNNPNDKKWEQLPEEWDMALNCGHKIHSFGFVNWVLLFLFFCFFFAKTFFFFCSFVSFPNLFLFVFSFFV